MALNIYMNDNYNEEARFAYMLMFDANNIGERKKLLRKIIESSYMSYLFTRYCNPNYSEQEIAFESIKCDVDSCYLFLKDCHPTDEQKREGFGILLADSNYAYLAIRDCDLTDEEKMIFYREYKHIYINKDLRTFLDYCMTLYDIISNEEKDKLVEMIFHELDSEMAEVLLNSKIELSEDLRDKLDSIFVIKRLA